MAWAAAEAPGRRSQFYRLQDPNANKGIDDFAPLTCNYLRCNCDFYYSKLFAHGRYKGKVDPYLIKGVNESFYVSIKLLASLVGNDLAQTSESDFVYTGKVMKDPGPDLPETVPIRDKNGLLIVCDPLPKNPQSFRAIWLKAWDGRDCMAAQPKLFRARYSDQKISKSVAIKILDDGKQRFGNLVSFTGPHNVTAKDVFSSLIEAYNQNGTCILVLWDDIEDKNSYVLLSQNPFKLYQTWIHRDTVDEYMKHTEIDSLVQNAVRYMPNMPDVLKNLEIVREWLASATTLQSIGEIIDNHPDEVIESIGETIEHHPDDVIDNEPLHTHTVETSLSSSKINNAISQDGGSAAQIMKMSAPELAGRALQWQWNQG